MRVLVTGGAGFIGSSLAAELLRRGDEVRILDDLSTGFIEHVPADADFVQGSIEDLELVRRAVSGTEVVFHEAASRAVSRSVEDPLGTDSANTHGTLNVLVGARDAGVRRVVLASSSSVYGGVAPLPTSELAPALPKSPYAVSKLAGEHYARVCWELYGLETVALRYFNVFGPRQRPDSAYAAVIPLFIDALRTGGQVVVHGDGMQSRDFTYIDDVVRANLLAASAEAATVSGRVYNVARGAETTLLELLDLLAAGLGVTPEPIFAPPRVGDVRHSRADATAAERDLGWVAQVSVQEGLTRTLEALLDRPR